MRNTIRFLHLSSKWACYKAIKNEYHRSLTPYTHFLLRVLEILVRIGYEISFMTQGVYDIWVKSWKTVCSATILWHKECKNINEVERLKEICEREIYWGTNWCEKKGNCDDMWQVRRFGDIGSEQDQGWAKIPGISMNNCACDTDIRFFHGNSVILIRFFSTKKKNLKTRAMRLVYVSEFLITKETYKKARHEDMTI